MARAPILLLLALLAAPALAPLASAQQPVPPQGVWTVFTTVKADVHANYATVHVIADIANRGRDPEFPFRVPIPDDAFVTGLTIERDGQLFTAQIAPRDAARTEYEQQKSQGQTAGLVEKDRHSSVYEYLINVAQTTNVRATLTYEEYLAADRGVYNVSLSAPVSGFGQDRGAQFQVSVTDPAGVESLWGTPDAQAQRIPQGWSVSYGVGPRPGDAATPFTASYTLPTSADAGSLVTWVENGTGYFAHRIRAPMDAARLPVDMVLVLDVSGSMSGLKLSQMKDAAGQVVRALNGDDRLGLVIFSSDASTPWTGLRAMDAAGRADAAREIDALLAGGGTNIGAAMQRGFSAFGALDASREAGRMPVLALLTDGQATEGETSRDALLAAARHDDAQGAAVFTVAFGADADWGLLHALAAQGDGTALRVPEGAGAEVDLRRFLTALATPALKDVHVTYGEGVTAYRTGASTLFAGSELLVVGTFDAARGMQPGVVTAQGPDGPRSWTDLPVAATDAAFLPRLVAYQRVHALQETLDAEGATIAMTDELTKLAMQWSFVTDVTSLVLALEPRETAATPAPAQGGSTMAVSYDSAGSAAPASYPATVPTATTSSPSPANGGFDARSGPVAGTAATPSPPAAKVPAPGLGLVVGALAAVALLLAARRRHP